MIAHFVIIGFHWFPIVGLVFITRVIIVCLLFLTYLLKSLNIWLRATIIHIIFRPHSKKKSVLYFKSAHYSVLSCFQFPVVRYRRLSIIY